MNATDTNTNQLSLTLFIGGTGKTGRRVVERLRSAKRLLRVGSRSALPAFDWNHEPVWDS